MTSKFRSIFLVLLAFAVGTLAFVFHPQAEETDEATPPGVSDTDVQTYIKIYSAMQDDHDLTIDNAIKPFNLSLEEFRQTERRIQGEARIVERVRDALLEHAKKRALFAQASDIAVASPTPTSSPQRNLDKKKKREKKP